MKAIKDFPGYFIDKEGNVYSTIQRHNQPKPKKPRLIASWKSTGYLAVQLAKNKKGYKRLVHRLLLETFVSECPLKMECMHLNGDRTDNRLENLRWGTRQENQLDRRNHGTDNGGERHPLSKLTKKQVLEIKKLGKKYKFRKGEAGGNYKEIAKKYNISPGTVGSIVRGITWKSV